jgi:TolA-binding protein
VQAYYNLGAVAASKGDKVKAKEIWSKLIKDYPKGDITELAKKSMNEI